MNDNEFFLQIKVLRSRVVELIESAEVGSRTPEELLQQAFVELDSSLEVLQEASEELQQLWEKQKHLELAQKAAKVGSFEWNIQTGVDIWSQELEELYGLMPGEFGGSYEDWARCVYPGDLQKAEADVQSALVTGKFFSDFRILWQDDSIHWLNARARVFLDAFEQPLKMVGMNVDITERKQAEEQLLRDAFRDPLTGLPNRALFMERLNYAVEYSKRHEDYLFAVLFLDLDRFKRLNDSQGHAVGDQVLLIIAQRLKESLRPTDVLARQGGDEFTILLEGLNDISDAIRVAERIQTQLRLPLMLEQKQIFTTASIGIALSAADYERPEDLVRNADIAMYRAKTLGTRYEIFHIELKAQAVARWQLEIELRQAVERLEFQIHYQPIVVLDTGFIVGWEALVRWQHPKRGLLAPADFLPLAVEMGLSIPIDQWVIAQACYQLKRWQKQDRVRPPLTISVNVCSPQLAQPDFVEYINQVLWLTNLDPSCLKLELIESVMMENGDLVMTKLAQLRALGVQIFIDDFGKGYSSLGRLRRFLINGLKIDCSFFSGSGIEEENLDIVEAVITLAQKLGVDVIAERVETKEQLALLRALKCDYAQGYFFSPPLSSLAAEELIKANPQW